MEKAKKSVEQMAKEANGRSRACNICSLFMKCIWLHKRYAAMLL